MSASTATATAGKLSVILTLKGREAFTPRWIDYHSCVGLPWRVIVGDGAPSEQTERLFLQAPRLRATYLRYDDSDLFAYYRKLRDVVAAAATPYVLLSDNDDFILPDGIARSVEFLDAHPDWVSCGGMILGVHVGNRRFSGSDCLYGGTLYSLRSIYPLQARAEDNAETRVCRLLREYVPTWYFVHRREALLKALGDVVERGISDVAIMELTVASELAALGRQKVDGSYAAYLRQMNSSQGAAAGGGFLGEALSLSIKRDVDAMTESIVALFPSVADADGTKTRLRAEIMSYRNERIISKTSIRLVIQQWLRRYLHTARAKIPYVHRLLSAWELRAVLASMRANGAREETIHAFRSAMGFVVDVVRPESKARAA